MNELRLSAPSGYDAQSNPRVASFAAQLDDQLRRLKKDVEMLEPKHFEWQPRPGMNTIGMLLAHLAIVDLWWLDVAPRELDEPAAEARFREVIGIGGDDDGMPVAATGTHPATLAGKSFADYWKLIEQARAAAHASLSSWTDADLDATYARGPRQVSREWTAYHVLEHFAGHYGQVLLLKHMLRDAGLLPVK